MRIAMFSMLFLSAGATFAADLYVDGVRIKNGVKNVEVRDSGDVHVTTSPATGGGGGGSSGGGATSASCGATPRNVSVRIAYQAWQYTGSMMVPLDKPDEIIAMKFVTGDNPEFRTGISFGSQSWTSNFGQHMWISECPGGPPVSTYCGKQGAGGVGHNLPWGLQESYIGRNDKVMKNLCVLGLKRQYYLNYQVPRCVPQSGIKYPCAGFYKNTPDMTKPFNLDGSVTRLQ